MSADFAAEALRAVSDDTDFWSSGPRGLGELVSVQNRSAARDLVRLSKENDHPKGAPEAHDIQELPFCLIGILLCEGIEAQGDPELVDGW